MAKYRSREQIKAFSRRFEVDRIQPEGLSDRIVASAEERAAVAELLELESLNSLTLAFDLKPVGARRFTLRGQLAGQLEQVCVVSLEPIEVAVDRAIEVEFVAEKEYLRRRQTEEDGLADPSVMDLEPIEGEAIDLGQLAYEYLATEIEPYPRKPGISFEWKPATTSAPAVAEDNGPFAALKVLKEK